MPPGRPELSGIHSCRTFSRHPGPAKANFWERFGVGTFEGVIASWKLTLRSAEMPVWRSGRRRKFFDLQIFHLALGEVTGESERLAEFDVAEAHRYLFSLGRNVEDRLVIDPALERIRADFEAEAVPAIGFEFDPVGRLVFVCGEIVQTRNADALAAPSPDDKCGARLDVTNREGQRGKKVRTGNASRLERDLVVLDRQRIRFARVNDRRHRLAGAEGEHSVLDRHRTVIADLLDDLEAGQFASSQKRLRLRLRSLRRSRFRRRGRIGWERQQCEKQVRRSSGA